MGLFSSKKEEKKEAPIEAEEAKIDDSKTAPIKSESEEKKIDSDSKTGKVLAQDVDGSLAYKFIVRPCVTEKTHDLMASSKYVFKTRREAGKNQVKKAVEGLYNVRVEKVNIVNIPQKKRRFGRIIGKKSGVKKAIVTLKEGDKIEIFE